MENGTGPGAYDNMIVSFERVQDCVNHSPDAITQKKNEF